MIDGEENEDSASSRGRSGLRMRWASIPTRCTSLRAGRLRVSILVVLVAVLAVACSSTKEGAASLSERWWNWQGAFPEETNPVLDRTGEFCRLGQPSDGDWLVAGSFGTSESRRCSVPVGSRLVGPLLNIFDTEDRGTSMLLSEGSSVRLDGERLKTFEERVRFRLRTVSRNPACNSCDVEVFAHGYWFRTEPLSSGAHRLVIDGRDASGFRTFVEYELVAE